MVFLTASWLQYGNRFIWPAWEFLVLIQRYVEFQCFRYIRNGDKSYLPCCVILVHAFSHLVPELLELAGKDGYFLSDKINQDPCEEHFGHIRMGGGSNQNPDALQYGYRSRKALVGKAETVKIMGNTKGKKRKGLQISLNDNRQLPKRPKKQWIVQLSFNIRSL